MKVLSLFDGVSCGQIALKELAIKIDRYYSSEIDKHAIAQTQLNFPDTIQLGSVTNWKKWDIDWSEIDLVLAGSPCQGFSFAGKQLAFDDPRSKLFFEFIAILRHVQNNNPNVKYLLENVKMAKEHELVISRYCGVAPIEINSALVSAQNRQRLYWTNIANEPYGLFGDMHCTIPQPKDRGILLRDILESEVNEKYYIKNPKFGFKGLNLNAKNPTLRIGGGASQDDKHNFDLIKIDVSGNPKANQEKASCFTAGGNSGGNHSDMDLICVAQRGGRFEGDVQKFEPRHDNKTNCLTSVAKDNYVVHNMMPRSSKTGKGGTGHLTRNDGKTYCLDTGKTNAVELGYRIRRLTPTECSRLQTVPLWYVWACSDTQKYRQLGNGWTVEVIKHILSHLPVTQTFA